MSFRSAVTKLQAVVAVVIIIIAIAAGAYYYSTTSVAPSTISTSSMMSSSMVTSAAASAGGTIVVDAPAIADTLDPAVAWHAQAYEADQNVYQGLVTYAPNSNQIVPLIAQNYTESPDGLTYKFNLRTNVVFSNGDPVNAYEFWYSMYRCVVMNQGPAYYITVALNMTGVTADMLNQYNTANDIPPASLLSIMQNPNLAITVTGPYSLEFHLGIPFAAFLATVTQPQDTVVDPLVVSQHGGVNASATNPWMFGNAVGTGPFTITDYEPNTQLVFQANTNYWGGANGVQPAPKLSKVIYKLVPDALTRLEDVQSGSAQLAYIDFTLAPQLMNATSVYVPKLGPMPVVHWLEFNTYKFPFNNKLIREAVAHAINVTALDTMYGGYAQGFAGPIPKGVSGYNSTLPSEYTFDPALAKQLLAQAGYPGGANLPTLQLRFSTDRTPESNVVPLIASELADIGIKVNLQGSTISEFDTFLGGTKPTDPTYPDMMYVTWFWFPDPWAFANWLIGPLGIPNPDFGGYNNTVANSLMSQADKTADPNQRAMLYEQVSEIVYNDVPCIWVAQYQNALPLGLPVASTKLQGFTYNLEFAQTDLSTLYMTS